MPQGARPMRRGECAMCAAFAVRPRRGHRWQMQNQIATLDLIPVGARAAAVAEAAGLMVATAAAALEGPAPGDAAGDGLFALLWRSAITLSRGPSATRRPLSNSNSRSTRDRSDKRWVDTMI